jgi:hypothetical protein
MTKSLRSWTEPWIAGEVMSITIRQEIDQHGYPRAVVATPFELVGRLLEGDIRSSRSVAAKFIAAIEQVERCPASNWEWTGDSLHVFLESGQARIECLWDESLPPCSIGLSDLRAAIEGWVQFVGNSSGQCGSS